MVNSPPNRVNKTLKEMKMMKATSGSNGERALPTDLLNEVKEGVKSSLSSLVIDSCAKQLTQIVPHQRFPDTAQYAVMHEFKMS